MMQQRKHRSLHLHSSTNFTISKKYFLHAYNTSSSCLHQDSSKKNSSSQQEKTMQWWIICSAQACLFQTGEKLATQQIKTRNANAIATQIIAQSNMID
jgi:hypothetical protein